MKTLILLITLALSGIGPCCEDWNSDAVCDPPGGVR